MHQQPVSLTGLGETSTEATKNKQLVQDGYDKMAEDYLVWTLNGTPLRLSYLNAILSQLQPNSAVLELGCGAGFPILSTIVDHPSVSKAFANDISSKQISLAKVKCPSATFLEGDMMTLSIPVESLDAIVAFFSVFHLPRSEQPAMLKKTYDWLKPGGLLAFNLGTKEGEELKNEFFGAEMFWSSFTVEQNKQMVLDIGFELLKTEVLESGDSDGSLKPGDPDYGIKFLWMIAKKPDSK